MHWDFEAVYQIHASYCLCVMLLLMIDPLKHVFLSSSLTHSLSPSPSLRVRLRLCLCRLNQFRSCCVFRCEIHQTSSYFSVCCCRIHCRYFFRSRLVPLCAFHMHLTAQQCTSHSPKIEYFACASSIEELPMPPPPSSSPPLPTMMTTSNRSCPFERGSVLMANKRTAIHLHHDSYHFLTLFHFECFSPSAFVCVWICASIWLCYCNALKLLSHEIIVNCVENNIRLCVLCFWKGNIFHRLLPHTHTHSTICCSFCSVFFPWNWFRSHSNEEKKIKTHFVPHSIDLPRSKYNFG